MQLLSLLDPKGEVEKLRSYQMRTELSNELVATIDFRAQMSNAVIAPW